MSMLFFAIPLSILIPFIFPIWFWSHDDDNGSSKEDLSQRERQRLMQLIKDAENMRKRIQVLEEILDLNHPNWRD